MALRRPESDENAPPPPLDQPPGSPARGLVIALVAVLGGFWLPLGLLLALLTR